MFVISTFSSQAQETVTIQGHIYYNHVLIAELVDVEPHFWFIKLDTGERPELSASFDAETSSYEIIDIPSANMKILVDFYQDWSKKAGDYQVSNTVNIADLTEEERTSVDLNATFYIHLLAPYDNSVREFSTTDEHATYANPITFTWETVNGAARYDFSIRLYRDTDHPDGYGFVDDVLEVTNYTDTLYTADLEDTGDYLHYSFLLSAYNDNDENIAQYVTPYTNGHGVDFRFKIGDVGVEENKPEMFGVEKPYPNPFNASVTIKYKLPASDFVELVLYDILGRKIAVLENGMREAGVHRVNWDGITTGGVSAASGVYFYRFSSGNIASTGKLMYLR